MEKEIRLNEIFGVLRKNLVFIILVTVLFGAATYLYQHFNYVPIYSAKVDLLCISQVGTDNITTSAVSQLDASTKASKSVVYLMSTDSVLDKVSEQLKQQYNTRNISASLIRKKIKIVQNTDTFVISVTATDEDPLLAQQIANLVAQVSEDVIPNSLDVDISVFQTAKFPESANLSKNNVNVAIAAVIGLVLIVAVILIRYFLDDKIKGPQDLMDRYNVSLLSLIHILSL